MPGPPWHWSRQFVCVLCHFGPSPHHTTSWRIQTHRNDAGISQQGYQGLWSDDWQPWRKFPALVITRKPKILWSYPKYAHLTGIQITDRDNRSRWQDRTSSSHNTGPERLCKNKNRDQTKDRKSWRANMLNKITVNNLAINTLKWWQLWNWKGQRQRTGSSYYTISQLNSSTNIMQYSKQLSETKAISEEPSATWPEICGQKRWNYSKTTKQDNMVSLVKGWL